MIAQVRNTIREYEMIARGDRVGVGLSGGADSVALFLLLTELGREGGFSVVALHYEHGIRGAASREDMAFCRALAKDHGVPFYAKRGDVPTEAARTGENLEACAHRLRYDFFARMTRELSLSSIALAHHMDDRAETALLHLVRGAGAAGLSSMQPVRGEPFRMIRPLIFASRRQIEAFLAEKGQRYRIDETNESTDYDRNYLRCEVMPRLTRLNPRAAEAICRAAQLLSEEDAELEAQAAKIEAGAVRSAAGRVLVDKDALLGAPRPVARRVLRRAARRAAPKAELSMEHIDALLRLASGENGKKFELAGKFFAVLWQKQLILAEKVVTIEAIEETPLCLPGEMRLGRWLISAKEARPPKKFPPAKSGEQYLALEALSGAVWRSRRQGDWFFPCGGVGAKPLRRYLTDQKVPPEERDGVLLLARGSEVLWVVGYALGEGAKVEDGSECVWRLCARCEAEETENE